MEVLQYIEYQILKLILQQILVKYQVVNQEVQDINKVILNLRQ